MSEVALPPPLTPPECDLRGMKFMPLDILGLLDSDFYALSTGDEFKAGVTLWCRAFLQVPAASLPDDDRILAHLSCAGPRWEQVRAMALRGWIKCADARLYHPVVAMKAHEVWGMRLAYRKRTEAATAARKAKPQRDVVRDDQRNVERDVVRDAERDVHQEKGKEKGTGREDSAQPSRKPPHRSPKPAPPTLCNLDGVEPYRGIETQHHGKPVVGGWFLDDVAARVIDAAGIDEARWRGDLRPLIAWLRDGYEPDDIVAELKRSAARPGYRAPFSLAWFDKAIRAGRRNTE